MSLEEMLHNQHAMLPDDIGPYSWWSWRPGIKPGAALLTGCLISLAGLAIASIGFVTLVLGILDSLSPPLPAANQAGNPAGSVALLLLGVILLVYPCILARWGLLDLLIERFEPQRRSRLTGQVVGLRAVSPTTRRDYPGMMPRRTRSWYGVALLPLEGPRRVLTLSINEHIYSTLQQGAQVQVLYSPHVHYVYTLEVVRG